MKKQYIGRSIALLLSFLLILCCGPITAFGQAPQENSQIVQSSEIEQSSLPEQENLIEQVSEPEQSSQPEQISEPVQESQSIQESQPEQSSQLAQESQVEQPSQPNYAPTSGIASNDIQTRAIDGPNTVEVGGEIELTGSDGYFHDWEYSSRDGGKVTIEENWRDGSEVTVTGVSAGRVTITHSYYNWYWREETFVLDVTSPNGNKIEAGVYLRYSNEVPRNINQDSEAADFGPSGNDSPYIKVTVDLDIINEKTQAWRNSSNWIYYSIDSDSSYNVGWDRKENAKNFWEEVIWPAIDPEDQAALNEIFGEGHFIGYVLKQENSGWHIDGVLAEEPPIYTVELYDADDNYNTAFSISSGGGEQVTYEQFKQRLEEYLDGESYTYNERNDNIVVEYYKNGVKYEATITPYGNNRYYHVYPYQDRFGYDEVTENAFYLSCMQITTRVIEEYASLTIAKNVTGNAANINEHFIFTLYCNDLRDSTYNVTYTGTDGCDVTHESQITFNRYGLAEIQLKHGETVTIQGLPKRNTIEVTESEQNDANNYTTKVSVDGGYQQTSKETGVYIQNQNHLVAFENSIATPAPTGFYMDILPYIVLAGVVLAGVIIFVVIHIKRKGPHNKDIWDE